MRALAILAVLCGMVMAESPALDWQTIVNEYMDGDDDSCIIHATSTNQNRTCLVVTVESSELAILIADDKGKILDQINTSDEFIFGMDSKEVQIENESIAGKPAFIVRWSSDDGGSGIRETIHFYNLCGVDKENNYSILLDVQDIDDMVISRYYGGIDLSSWTWGGSNGTQSKSTIPKRNKAYPDITRRVEEYTSDYDNGSASNKITTNAYYEIFTFSPKYNQYEAVDETDVLKTSASDSIKQMALASIAEANYDYPQAYAIYQKMTGDADEEVAKAASLAVKRLEPSAPFDFEDLVLFKSGEYGQIVKEYPTSPLAAQDLLNSSNDAATQLRVLESYPNTGTASDAAFSLLFKTYDTVGGVDLLKAYNSAITHLTTHEAGNPTKLAYYYGLYGDRLMEFAVDQFSVDKELLAKARQAYQTGLETDPSGNFCDYFPYAIARSHSLSGDDKTALKLMLDIVVKNNYAHWNGWNWLNEKASKDMGEENISYEVGEACKLQSGSTVLFWNRWDKAGDNNYFTDVVTDVKGKLYRLSSIPGSVAEAHTASLISISTEQLWVLTRGNDQYHFSLLELEGTKLRSLLDLLLDTSVEGQTPMVTFSNTTYPRTITIQADKVTAEYKYDPHTKKFVKNG